MVSTGDWNLFEFENFKNKSRFFAIIMIEETWYKEDLCSGNEILGPVLLNSLLSNTTGPKTCLNISPTYADKIVIMIEK